MSIDRILLNDGARAFDIELSEDQIDALEAYYDAVIDSNRDFNLTAITAKEDFVVKHFIDSLSGARYVPVNASVCDIGAGAGFPSVPLAVARPDITVTAIDSTAKKTVFIADTAKAIGIKNIKTRAARVEDCKDLFGLFDCVVARAVSSLPILLELALPLLKVGGVFIAYKTDESEIALSSNALTALGGVIDKTDIFNLPNGDRRALIVVKKIKQTPQIYPRQYGAIKKKPL